MTDKIGPWIEATRRDDEAPCWLRRVRWYDAALKAERERFDVIDEDEYGLPRCASHDLQYAQSNYAARRNSENLPTYTRRLLASVLTNVFDEHTRRNREGR